MKNKGRNRNWNLPYKRNLAEADSWSHLNVVKFMQSFFLFVTSHLLNDKQENRIEENNEQNQDRSIVFVFVNHQGKTVPLQKKCNEQEKYQQVDVIDYWHFPLLEQKVRLFLFQLIQYYFFVRLNYISEVVEENVGSSQLLQSKHLVVS